MTGLHAGPRPCVALAAARAPWEPTLLGVLARAGILVLRRCVDLPDLLAVVASGQVDVAVLSADLAGLDADVVRRLAADDVRPLVVAEPGADLERMARLGIPVVANAEAVPEAVEALLAAPAPGAGAAARPSSRAEDGAGGGPVIAVWGPTGAPGRTTVAVGIAAHLASGAGPDSGRGAVLVDADPWGGTVAQALGILDEASGLLGAARLAAEGALEEEGLARCLRRVAERFDVLTGLPRADRWIEVRPGVLERVLRLAAAHAAVVVDVGFALERDGAAHDRNAMTLEALGAADVVVVVGSAEPAGLSRLVRGLVELGDVLPGVRPQVVVNRMREGLGWSRHDVAAMVEGFVPSAPVHVLPLDLDVADRAAREGRAIPELGETQLGAALRVLADQVAATTAQVPNRR